MKTNSTPQTRARGLRDGATSQAQIRRPSKEHRSQSVRARRLSHTEERALSRYSASAASQGMARHSLSHVPPRVEERSQAKHNFSAVSDPEVACQSLSHVPQRSCDITMDQQESYPRGSSPVPGSDGRACIKEGRRHFRSPTRSVMNPETLPQEAHQSRAMVYQQTMPEQEESKDDALWKRIGVFDATKPETARSPSKEAPHRSSHGFVAAQKMPTLKEKRMQTPRRPSKEFESPGMTSYFSNELVPPPLSVRRAEDSRNTSSDFGLIQHAHVNESPSLPPREVIDAHLHKPWAIGDVSSETTAEAILSHLGKSSQTARKNTSGGALENGLVTSSAEEGFQSALGFQSKIRASVEACMAMALQTPCWKTNPLPTPEQAPAITDGLPSYNAEVTVKSLLNTATESGIRSAPQSPSPATRCIAPYAHVETASLAAPKARSMNLPIMAEGAVGVKSLMSSGHPQAISAIADERRSKSKELAEIEERQQRGSSPAHAPALAASSQPQCALGTVAEDEAAAISRLGVFEDRKPARAQSLDSHRFRSSIASSPGRRLSVSSGQNNHALSTWTSGLRGGISDQPWISMADTHGKKFSGFEYSALPLPRSGSQQQMNVRNQIWKSSSRQLSQVQDFMAKGCEERIAELHQELHSMNSRNSSFRRLLDNFRNEALDTPALLDAPSPASRSRKLAVDCPTKQAAKVDDELLAAVQSSTPTVPEEMASLPPVSARYAPVVPRSAAEVGQMLAPDQISAPTMAERIPSAVPPASNSAAAVAPLTDSSKVAETLPSATSGSDAKARPSMPWFWMKSTSAEQSTVTAAPLVDAVSAKLSSKASGRTHLDDSMPPPPAG